MRKNRYREENSNWRGGRSIASNGYVLIRLGVGHPLADVRGYAYEHRVVAAQALGRPLADGEEVHHKDGDKRNNHPSNLQVMSGRAEHFVEHRRRFDLRMPEEDNPLIDCACGCGEQILRYDSIGRPRQYVSGHNAHPSPTEDAIFLQLSQEPQTRSQIAAAIGKEVRPVATALSKMKKKGRAVQAARGGWIRGV